jgi:TonB family protein
MKRLFALCLLTTAFTFAEEPPELSVRSMDIPRYPPLAYQARIQGTVELRVAVNPDGQVTKATVTSGPTLLQGLTAENIKTWHFAPSAGGKSSELVIRYEYKIEGKEIPYLLPDKQSFRVKLELPTSVEISAPPMKIDTIVTDSN